MSLFDTYVAVDWSASGVPKTGKDSIWICASGSRPVNPATRDAATAIVRDLLVRESQAGRRVLIGFDFPYSYPAGFADLVAPGAEPAWRRVWSLLARLVKDDGRNASNRFAVAASLNRALGGQGPFWGCPRTKLKSGLTSTRPFVFPNHGLAEIRSVDSRTPCVQSVWKLFGAGSVGSQTLVGIPRVLSLRDDDVLAGVSRVWPFETGWAVPDAQVVHVEIWPGLVTPVAHAIRDAGQVAGVVKHWQALDRRGKLGRLFAPVGANSAGLEEGWILG